VRRLQNQRYFEATARTALGFVRNCEQRTRRAARLLAPLLHPWARAETPRSAANSDCDSPVLLRASMAGEEATTTWPAFISRTDCSSSAARSRLSPQEQRAALERGLLFEGTADLLELCTGEVVCAWPWRRSVKQDDLSFGGACKE
jgi:hypothetical protein